MKIKIIKKSIQIKNIKKELENNRRLFRSVRTI